MRSHILSRCSIVPLAAVLPIVVYAYAVQSIVTSRTEVHERRASLLDIRAIELRLEKLRRADALTCRDYAHWDETYQHVRTKHPTWLDANLANGIAYSFGFDIFVLQSASGDVVYQNGANDRILRDLRGYGLLERCLRRKEGTGLVTLDRRVYTYSAHSVLMTDHTGPPRGMMFVARLLRPALLADLSPGPRHRIALREASGRIVGRGNLGPPSKLPAGVSDILGRVSVPIGTSVYVSNDGTMAYGVLPISDARGRPAGALIDVRSRVCVMATLRAIRHMSVSLMVLCVVVGVAGTGYFRNRALAQRASRDELTGLYNHGHVQGFLKNQVQLAERYDRPLAIMMVDIDHFKYVNDSHGHTAGDTVLKSVAATMVGTIRATDLAARYGGEEFVVVLPETDLHHAMAGAERLRLAVQSHVVRTRTVQEGRHSTSELALTVSVGVASYPDDGKTSLELLHAADAALNEAKRTRNTIRAYRDILRNSASNPKRIAVLDGFLRDPSISTVRPLITAIDTRDPGSVRHSEKTAEYAVATGRELGLSTQDLASTCKAALLHDVGMIGVPDHLLTKTGRLTEEETAIIRRHCALGADILSQSPHTAAVAETVLRHHERWDGAGYPGGLAGEEIPIVARIVAAANSLDAMTSPRSYRNSMSLGKALGELRAESGKQFDPRVIDALSSVVQRMLQQHETRRAA